jgi:ribosomal protein L7/L12
MTLSVVITREGLLVSGAMSSADDVDFVIKSLRAAQESLFPVGRMHSVTLRHVPDDRRINTIKEVRAFTGLGLKEAKDLVDKVSAGNPTIVASMLPHNDAVRARSALESHGCAADISLVA